MTKAGKEQIQYLLTQYLEGVSNENEEALLFSLLNNEQDDTEWEPIIEELIASEPEESNYEPEKWDSTIRTILRVGHQQKDEAEGESSLKKRVLPVSQVINLPGRKRWLWAASVAAMLIIIVTVWLVNIGDTKSLITTEYAQQKKILLPDETEIVLNSNSTIKYSREWKPGQPREVWLNGEALFRVKHLNNDTNSISAQERFIVHTDLATIEVLGTVFNVRERRGKTEIVLEQGRIKVSFIKSADPDIIMQPGQIVTVSADIQRVVTKPIKSEDYTAWTQKKLVLTDASFQQIVEYMEDNFGKRIILTDPGLANRKVEGTFKMDNMDDALLVLSKALNVDITQKGDTLIFTSQ